MPCGSPGWTGSGSGCCALAPASRRDTVDRSTPSRAAISASLSPPARHRRARTHAGSGSLRGRPDSRTSPGSPSRSARLCSVAT
jgi:hypothetical protein